ncbi:MAG: glycosyltransferase family 39 protein [Verrucomicrobiae bacterium]|nr:glycosyltransferase family 39 protein [Verrucomicrobiae bacterium]
MHTPASPGNPGAARNQARRLVRCVQLGFLIIAALQISGPFLTAHNERQNQTFDTARHVFDDGWSAVLTPRASFSLPGYESRPYTVIRQEFPFHGALGWPLVKCFGHEEIVVRLISIVFALLSIELIYLILQRWLDPGGAVIGAALWGLSPLVLHFGQVPMPDILCTTGMLGAFWFAGKPNLPAASACFLFAILAKASVIFFGLPILTALWLAKNCRTPGDFIRVALWWGIAPLTGLVCWTALEIRDPDSPWTVVKIMSERSSVWNLLTAKFYLFLAGSVLAYGLGVLGSLGCLLAVIKHTLKVRLAIVATVIISSILYVLVAVAKIPEPQYILPLLAWLVMAAASGLNGLAGRPAGWGRRSVLAVLVAGHVLAAYLFTSDLKASHIAGFSDIENAAKLIPPNSRVIAAYPFYGASPAVWLKQNTLAVHSPGELETSLPLLQADGFDYLIILDVKSHSVNAHAELGKLAASLFHTGPDTQPAANLIDYTATNSPFRQFCDARFKPLQVSRYVVLYSLRPAGRE